MKELVLIGFSDISAMADKRQAMSLRGERNKQTVSRS
jgi:hypothetical protein